MEDELLKIKYRQLYNDLQNIKGKLDDLGIAYNELSNGIKETLMLDGKVLDEDIFESIRAETNNIRSELVDFVIPEVSKKM